MNGERIAFDWDRHNLGHLFRHGVTQKEVEEAFSNRPYFMDVEEDGGEERWSAVGPTNGLRMLHLIFTYREGRVRPISAWDASKELLEVYFEHRGE